MSHHRVTLEMGEDDYKFLAATAKLASIAPRDMLAACWKIGAGAYAARLMGYELPTSLTEFTPDALAPIFQEFLAKYEEDAQSSSKEAHR
jgi:hypothetical protein